MAGCVSSSPASSAPSGQWECRIQFASDLHIEASSSYEEVKCILTPSAPYLVLAGDICQASDVVPFSWFEKLLAHLSPLYEAIFYVAGNHSFYNDRAPVGKVPSGAALQKDPAYQAAVAAGAATAVVTKVYPASTLSFAEVHERLEAVCSKFPNVFHLHRHSFWISPNGVQKLSRSVPTGFAAEQMLLQKKAAAVTAAGGGAGAAAEVRASSPAAPSKLQGVRLVGCTLWSHIPRHGKAATTSYLNDYRLILPFRESVTVPVVAPAAKGAAGAAGAGMSTEQERMSIGEVYSEGLSHLRENCYTFLEAEHDKDLGFLHQELASSSKAGEPATVVVTHHAPTMQGSSHPQYRTPLHNLPNYGFATPLEYLFAQFNRPDNSNVKLWISGHTHFNMDSTLFGTRCVSNQHGYSWGAKGEIPKGTISGSSSSSSSSSDGGASSKKGGLLVIDAGDSGKAGGAGAGGAGLLPEDEEEESTDWSPEYRTMRAAMKAEQDFLKAVQIRPYDPAFAVTVEL